MCVEVSMTTATTVSFAVKRTQTDVALSSKMTSKINGNTNQLSLGCIGFRVTRKVCGYKRYEAIYAKSKAVKLRDHPQLTSSHRFLAELH